MTRVLHLVQLGFYDYKSSRAKEHLKSVFGLLQYNVCISKSNLGAQNNLDVGKTDVQASSNSNKGFQVGPRRI